MINNNKLLIQNLDPKLNKQTLTSILSLISPVIDITITPDSQNANLNCAHVELHEHRATEQILHAMDGRIIYGKKIRVKLSSDEEDIGSIKISITNLDPSIDNIALNKAFNPFNPLMARVTGGDDMSKTNNGTITFSTREHAESAIQEMNDKKIGLYPIKCSFSSGELNTIDLKKSSTSDNEVLLANTSYEKIFAQAPLYNTSISIGNLPKQIIKRDITPYLQQYGHVSEIYLEANKGTGYAKLDTHANAATAIFALQGINIGGKEVQFGWAKGRLPERLPSRDSLSRAYNVFSLGHASPKRMVRQITDVYDNYNTMRPPAPAFDQTDDGNHGWNQYYQKYYSAGHLTI